MDLMMRWEKERVLNPILVTRYGCRSFTLEPINIIFHEREPCIMIS